MNIRFLFDRFGRPCSYNLPDESKTEMNAFISPLRYKNKMYLYGVNTEIGYNSEGYYLYIGPADPAISTDDGGYIQCGDDRYKIDRAEKVYKENEVFYVWAVIRKTVETEDENE